MKKLLKWLTKKRWALMYAANLKAGVGAEAAKTEMKEFITFLGLALFVLRDRTARAAMLAERVQIIQITG